MADHINLTTDYQKAVAELFILANRLSRAKKEMVSFEQTLELALKHLREGRGDINIIRLDSRDLFLSRARIIEINDLILKKIFFVARLSGQDDLYKEIL